MINSLKKFSIDTNSKDPRRKLVIDIVHIENSQDSRITEFWFKSSENITDLFSDVTVSEFTDTFLSSSHLSFEKNKWYFLAGYENVSEGQVWQFRFEGTELNDGEKFFITVDYKV